MTEDEVYIAIQGICDTLYKQGRSVDNIEATIQDAVEEWYVENGYVDDEDAEQD